MRPLTASIGLFVMALLFASSVIAQSYEFRQTVQGLVEKSQAYASCKSILDAGESQGDGLYTINPPGASSLEVYCDMTSAGGGWTLVVAQLEADPVRNWDEGIQADYDPTLTSRQGFTLNSTEIPSHTQVSFGKDLDADFIDYVNFNYSTGDIPKSQLAGLKTGAQYHVHRSAYGNYPYHDPEESLSNKTQTDPWIQTLTFDVLNGRFTFAFSPLHGTQYARGYGLDGLSASGSSEAFAWTVWVR